MNAISIDWDKNSDGLIPCIVQNFYTGKVLMIGYFNKLSYEKTLKDNLVTFYSRSKQRLWQKGEESGNTLQFVSITSDCDKDALLVQAIPNGPTCHTGKESCFDDGNTSSESFLLRLIQTISDRAESKTTESYTVKLLEGGPKLYGGKVLEEAAELLSAVKGEGKQRVIEESADLLYSLLVLLQGQEVSFSDVINELSKRS